jgi:acyl-CoA reductase-like NAD-dependent aldehyde dehydrogenase
VKRVFVAREIFDEVRDRVVRKTKALKVGDQTLADTDVGPIITLKAAERVEAQIKQSVAEGAKLLTGGGRKDQFVSPAVLVDVGRDNIVMREEVFGPVLPLMPFDTIDDAIAMANASNYGLQAAIFTNDLRSVMAASMKLEVGTVIINHQTAMRIESLPFGGRKMSGNGGREGFMETLKDMSETKTIVIKNAYDVYA